MTSISTILSGVIALTLGGVACRRDAGPAQRDASGGTSASTAAGASAGSANTTATASTVKTWPADADPCRWITADEAAKLLGPLAGPPWRASQADGAKPDAEGHACGYTLAAPNGGTVGDDQVAVEIDTDEVTTMEGAAAMFGERIARDGAGSPLRDAANWLGLGGKPLPGWDYTGGVPELFTARIGGLAVRVGISTRRVPGDSIARLAALVRDRVPDLPRLSERAAERFGESDKPDACTLITREEAERVLGTLTMAPYRTDGHTPNADPGGSGCAYYLGNHRVLTIDPAWQQGKRIFRLLAGMGQGINSALGVNGVAADTLEGAWDQASSPAPGMLYLLKNDGMLTLQYRTAGVELPKALALASTALERLANGPPGTRARVRAAP